MFSLLVGRALGPCRLHGGNAMRVVLGAVRGHKTVSSVKKRVRITGSGNLKRGQSGMRHITGPKPRSRLRSLGQTKLILGKQKKKVLWMLGG
ncbi:unnamed protein product [Ectocarpus sp. 6 AP-2014]